MRTLQPQQVSFVLCTVDGERLDQNCYPFEISILEAEHPGTGDTPSRSEPRNSSRIHVISPWQFVPSSDEATRDPARPPGYFAISARISALPDMHVPTVSERASRVLPQVGLQGAQALHASEI